MINQVSIAFAAIALTGSRWQARAASKEQPFPKVALAFPGLSLQ